MNNGQNDRDNQRRLPPPIPDELISNEYRNGKVRQPPPPRAPLRAIQIKGDQLRAAVRNGCQLDWADLFERYVDLWQEGRMALWRAKHSKRGLPQTDPVTGKTVETYVADDKTVLEGIEVLRGVLDSMVKVRKEMGEPAGIPRWAVEKIESALRDYPEARLALLKALAAEDDAVMQ